MPEALLTASVTVKCRLWAQYENAPPVGAAIRRFFTHHAGASLYACPSSVPKSGQVWDPNFASRSPLFRPFAELTRAFAEHSNWPALAEYDEWVDAQRRARASELVPLRFKPPPKRPRRAKRGQVVLDELYDGSIALGGVVPCLSASYHDLFNALMFAAFPKAKRALHERQFRALSSWATPGAARLPAKRTREQDALTVFDEGGSVVVMTRPLERKWREQATPLRLPLSLPLSLDAEPGAAMAVCFGHALLEHAYHGHFEVRSCAVVLVVEEVPKDAQLTALVDSALCERIRDESRFTAPGADGVVQFDAMGAATLGPASDAV